MKTKKGSIYTIELGEEIYVGSTVEPLKKREYNHNYKFKHNTFSNNKLYKKCIELGITKIECKLLKIFEYQNIKELRNEEEKYRVELNASLNSLICNTLDLTIQEYRKKYKNENHEKMKTRGKEKIKCPNCKVFITRQNLTRHMKRKICLDYIEN